ncbi:hypothetical protein EB796_023389 [Bugula neritina]|uniref:Uncharacterized protein n=1 Tax=Bugula neritina TaxID=10212 RepID=A0A7J7IWL9_BUGNE|nr:hypothetical protein EB796_023389 [Bugula neritina]
MYISDAATEEDADAADEDLAAASDDRKSDDELTLEEAMYISDAATEEDADAADKDLAAASDDRVVGHRKTSEEISSHMQENCKEMNKEAVNKCKAKIQTVQDRCVNEKQEIFQSVDFAVPNGCDFSPDDSECDQMASKGDVDASVMPQIEELTSATLWKITRMSCPVTRRELLKK